MVRLLDGVVPARHLVEGNSFFDWTCFFSPWVATPLKEVLTSILAGNVGSVCQHMSLAQCCVISAGLLVPLSDFMFSPGSDVLPPLLT